MKKVIQANDILEYAKEIFLSDREISKMINGMRIGVYTRDKRKEGIILCTIAKIDETNVKVLKKWLIDNKWDIEVRQDHYLTHGPFKSEAMKNRRELIKKRKSFGTLLKMIYGDSILTEDKTDIDIEKIVPLYLYSDADNSLYKYDETGLETRKYIQEVIDDEHKGYIMY